MPRQVKKAPTRNLRGLGADRQQNAPVPNPPSPGEGCSRSAPAGRTPPRSNRAPAGHRRSSLESTSSPEADERANATSRRSVSEQRTPRRRNRGPAEHRRSSSESNSAPAADERGRRSASAERHPFMRARPVDNEIRLLQSTGNLLIPKLPFARCIREEMQKYDPTKRITTVALMAIQEASEIYLTQLYEDSLQCCFHRARVTLMPKDMQLVLFLRSKR